MSHNQAKKPWYAKSDPWVLSQDRWDPQGNVYFETIFTQSNGYMGIRAYSEEVNRDLSTYREGYLAGVFAQTDQGAQQLTRVDYEWPMLAMITLPELFGCAIELNGEIFNLSAGTLDSYHRRLNLANGELVREIIWLSPSRKRTKLEFKRFLSAAVPHLGMQQITFTALNWSGEVQLKFELDGTLPTIFRTGDRSLPHIPQNLLHDQSILMVDNKTATLTFRTRGTDHLVAISSAVSAGNPSGEQSNQELLVQKSSLKLSEGVPTSLTHALAVVHDRDPVEVNQIPSLSAQIAQEHLDQGYQSGIEESTVIWNERWSRSDIVVDGPIQDQIRIRFSVFQILQMAPFQADNLSIPARGLSYNRYHGLYYWDSETFIFPQLLYTHPEVAHHLLHFRYRTLPGARRNAEYLNASGACYPWMTDSEDGTEQAPWHIGEYLWHQNASIAYAIDQYVRSTGDLAFMISQGYEIIAESARFWISQLQEDSSGHFHLNETVGPDELEQAGMDNGYVSLLAQNHLHLAVDWGHEIQGHFPAEAAEVFKILDLSEDEISTWEQAAERIHIPLIPELSIPLQDQFLLSKKPLDFSNLSYQDAYAKRRTHRVIKQADIILAMILLQDHFTRKEMEAAYDFYEPITVHFSSLSYSSHAILAALIGRSADAYRYFVKGAGFDIDNVGEGAADGLHAAALAAVWQMLVYGFLGMQLIEGGLAFEPHPPREWSSLSLSIQFQEYLLKVNLTKVSLEIEVEGNSESDPALLIVGEDSYELQAGTRIKHAFSSEQPNPD